MQQIPFAGVSSTSKVPLVHPFKSMEREEYTIMKCRNLRNSSLAMFGLASLLIYVLACTSFSPDDKKVLYTALDPASGLVGISVYDRQTEKSELLFVPSMVEDGGESTLPVMVRAQWLHNGKDVLVSWASPKNSDDSLHLAVVPFLHKGPTRIYMISAKEAASRLILPLAVSGSHLFFPAKTNRLARLDLDTGLMSYNDGWDDDSCVLPTRSGRDILYFTTTEMGIMNPRTFERSKQVTIPESEQQGEQQVLVSIDGGQYGYLTTNGPTLVLNLFESGKPVRVLPLQATLKETEKLGLLTYSMSQKRLYAPYIDRSKDDKSSILGFLEIPLDGSPPIRTVLFETKAEFDKEDTTFFFQPSISNDGKTLAVSTTYLSGKKGANPKDCALYFIDLSSPKRTIKRVAIPQGPRNLLSDLF